MTIQTKTRGPNARESTTTQPMLWKDIRTYLLGLVDINREETLAGRINKYTWSQTERTGDVEGEYTVITVSEWRLKNRMLTPIPFLELIPVDKNGNIVHTREQIERKDACNHIKMLQDLEQRMDKKGIKIASAKNDVDQFLPDWIPPSDV